MRKQDIRPGAVDTIMQSGDEVTGRIRWEQPVLTLFGYVAGEVKVPAFTIQCPQGDERDWTLISSLPGQSDWRLCAGAPDRLRKAAEAWLAEFVSSLGAAFPDETPPAGEGGR